MAFPSTLMFVFAPKSRIIEFYLPTAVALLSLKLDMLAISQIAQPSLNQRLGLGLGLVWYGLVWFGVFTILLITFDLCCRFQKFQLIWTQYCESFSIFDGLVKSGVSLVWFGLVFLYFTYNFWYMLPISKISTDLNSVWPGLSRVMGQNLGWFGLVWFFFLFNFSHNLW